MNKLYDLPHLVRYRQFYAPGIYQEPRLGNLLAEITYTASQHQERLLNSQ